MLLFAGQSWRHGDDAKTGSAGAVPARQGFLHAAGESRLTDGSCGATCSSVLPSRSEPSPFSRTVSTARFLLRRGCFTPIGKSVPGLFHAQTCTMELSGTRLVPALFPSLVVVPNSKCLPKQITCLVFNTRFKRTSYCGQSRLRAASPKQKTTCTIEVCVDCQQLEKCHHEIDRSTSLLGDRSTP